MYKKGKDLDAMPCHLRRRIVIIGAGAAGLAAAMQFRKMKYQNVIILEALNQVGGRIRTIKHGENALEIGAQWIRGKVNNVVLDLAKKNGLLDKSAPNHMNSIWELKNISCEEREIILPTLKFLNKTMNPVIYETHLYSCIPKSFHHVWLAPPSLDEYLNEKYQEACAESDIDVHAKGLKEAAYLWFRKFRWELSGGADILEEVSLNLNNNYKDCDESQSIELTEGYSSILDLFLKEIPSDWFAMNKVVKSIDWSLTVRQPMEVEEDESKGVIIICEDGSEFVADHVIVTMSLGYLKEHAHFMFEPYLPDKKLNAIRCIGHGTVNKIYLEYDKPFWMPGDIFNVLWTPNIENRLAEIAIPAPWSKDINRFSYVYNQPNLLCAWIAGLGAMQMEKIADSYVQYVCHQMLKIMFSNNFLPAPTKIIRSQWYSEKFFLGSHSYLTIQNELQKCGIEDLAEPICTIPKGYPVLLFAGEATHPSFYSTVHGAVESGIREAERLNAHFEKGPCFHESFS